MKLRCGDLGLALLVLVGCQAAPAPDSPGKPRPSSLSLSLGPLRSSLTPGTPIGGRMDRATGNVLEPAFAGDFFPPLLVQELLSHLKMDLRRQGFQVLDTGTKDRAWKSDLILRGTISSWSSGEFRQGGAYATAVVGWEMVDRTSGLVMHASATEGRVNHAEKMEIARQLAMQRSLARFLSLPGSKAALHRKQGPILAPALAAGEKVVLQHATVPSFPHPEDMLDQALKAVFSLQTPQGHGTGFFLREDGIGLTSRHLVAGRRFWLAHLPGGRQVKLKVLREDVELDLALVQAEGKEHSWLPLGDSDSLRPGQEIYSIGTPVFAELTQSVSRGIVSALRREDHRTLIQTDLAINPGSSGGPILNRAGKVVGVVNLKLIGGDVEGVGFGVSIADARSAFLLTLP